MNANNIFLEKKIMITGGAGFIGSTLINYLINETDNFVLNLDKLTYAHCDSHLDSLKGHPKYTFIQGDICNQDHVNDLFKKDNTNIVDVCKIQNCKEDNCLICLDAIEKDEEIYDLPCKHKFHCACLDQSISFQHYHCPSCREKIPIRKKNNHIIKCSTNKIS